MTIIESVFAREILDSRGNPTVEAEVVLEGGALGRAAVPSGASTGEREAVELRDGDKKRYLGRACRRRWRRSTTRSPGEIIGEDALDQALIDQLHDRARRHRATRAGWAPTPSWPSRWPWPRRPPRPPASRSTATWAAPNARTLPVPFMNIVNGGAHADNKLDPQEFMIVPHGAASFAEALRMGVEVFHHLKAILKKKGHGHRRWATRAASRPTCTSNEEALETILDAIRAAGYKAGRADLAGPGRGGQRVPRGQEVRLQEVGRRRAKPPDADGQDVRGLGEGLPDRLHRGRRGREGLAGLEGAHARRWARRCSSWATTSS